MSPDLYEEYGRRNRSLIGIGYLKSEVEARAIVDTLSERIYYLERQRPAYMGMDMAMPQTQIVYRDSAPPVIPTNKKLTLINK